MLTRSFLFLLLVLGAFSAPVPSELLPSTVSSSEVPSSPQPTDVSPIVKEAEKVVPEVVVSSTEAPKVDQTTVLLELKDLPVKSEKKIDSEEKVEPVALFGGQIQVVSHQEPQEKVKPVETTVSEAPVVSSSAVPEARKISDEIAPAQDISPALTSAEVKPEVKPVEPVVSVDKIQLSSIPNVKVEESAEEVVAPVYVPDVVEKAIEPESPAVEEKISEVVPSVVFESAPEVPQEPSPSFLSSSMDESPAVSAQAAIEMVEVAQEEKIAEEEAVKLASSGEEAMPMNQDESPAMRSIDIVPDMLMKEEAVDIPEPEEIVRIEEPVDIAPAERSMEVVPFIEDMPSSEDESRDTEEMIRPSEDEVKEISPAGRSLINIPVDDEVSMEEEIPLVEDMMPREALEDVVEEIIPLAVESGRDIGIVVDNRPGMIIFSEEQPEMGGPENII